MAKAKKKEVVIEDVIVEDATVVEQDIQEVTLNLPLPDIEATGHHSRDFKDILK